MNKSVRNFLAIALPIIAIASFALLLAFSLIRLAKIEEDMRLEASPNMLWVISRAHLANLQLSEAATKRILGEIEQAELLLRYDVFLSRLSLLNDGPQLRQIELMGFKSDLDAFRENLSKISLLVADMGQENLLQAQQLHHLLEPYNSLLTQAANKAMIAEWDNLGNKLDTSRGHLSQIIISLVGISFAGLLLVAHFMLVAREARERRKLLNKEKAFSELLIASSGEAIIAIDMNRQCTVWNEAAERLFALNANKAIGKTIGDISGLFQTSHIKAAIDNALSGDATSLPDEPLFLTFKEEPLYIDLRCFSLRNGERIIGAIMLVSDVTERRTAQKEIAEHRDHLEHLVQERTQELDAALARERITADLYRNFGAMISHQFRTPLAIVDSALQRMMRKRHSLTAEEVNIRGSKARYAISRLTKLIESTLDAARLDAGQIEIHTQACDLGQLISEICASTDDPLARKKLNIKLPKQPVIAYCDPVHAEHIFSNLLSNALKYSSPDTPIIINVETDDTRAICSVINHTDIDTQVHKHDLFERYYRGKNSQGKPGIGIGLYMAKALAQLQDGDVETQPISQNQICFILKLPLAGGNLIINKAERLERIL